MQTTVVAFREDCEFSRTLRKHEFRVVNVPLIATRPLTDLSSFKRTVATVDRFDGIFITSASAASIFADVVSQGDMGRLPPVYVLGNRSRRVLEERSIAVKYSETANTAGELLDQLDESEFEGRSLLFVRGEKSLRTIPDRLGGIAKVEEAVVYDTVEIPVDEKEVRDLLSEGKADWMCFFSPTALESFVKRDFSDIRKLPKLAVIGETTASKARSLGFNVDFISQRASAPDFAEGLARHIKDIEQ